MIDRVFGFKSS